MLACMLWHDVQARWKQLQRRRRAAVPGAAAGDRRGLRRAHRRHLRPRQARRRHARDLADAAALRAPQRQLAAQRWSSSRAFAPGSTSCACAPTPARSTRALADWWEDFSLADDDERHALLHSAAPARCGTAQAAQPPRLRERRRRRRAGEEAPAPPAQAGRDGRRGAAGRRRLSARPRPAPAMSRTERRAARAAPSSASAPTSAMPRPRCRARSARWRGCRDTRVVARSSLYRSAPIDSSGADYLNAVLQLSTALAPRAAARRAAAHRSRAWPRAAVSQRAAHARPRPAALRHERLASAALTLPHPRCTSARSCSGRWPRSRPGC